MSQPKVNQFVEDFEHFNDCFSIFSRDRFEQEHSLVIKRLVKALVSSEDFQNIGSVFNVLSVGAGSGQFDTLFAEEFTQYTLPVNCRVKWTAVDPDKTALAEFRKKLRAYDFEIPGVDFHWVESKIEDFMKLPNVGQKSYDLVLFVHCLPYMNAERVLKGTYANLLARNGSVYIVADTPENLCQQLLKEFRGGNDVLAIEEAIRRVSVRHSLKQKKFAAKMKFRVGEIFNNDNNNGVKLLQFMLRSNLKKSNADKMNKVKDFIRKHSWSEKVEEQDELFASNETVVYLLLK